MANNQPPPGGPLSEADRSVLLIEDDDGIAAPLAAALRGDGYAVVRVATGAEALEQAGGGVSAVVLDLGLPDLDGVEVCRRLRAAHPDVPVLMLTARTSEVDIVVGLDAGADDYLTKPFRLAELLARLRALLRRSDRATDPRGSHRELAAQDVRVDPASRRAWVGERELELAPKEFDLLALRVEHRGAVVSRDRAMTEVWDANWYGSTKTLDMHVSWLRRKLGDSAVDPRYITTVRGVGFRFESPHGRP
ncbi:MAG TPA: response regulator transcription factor [Egibacteraceae bacterium]|nr:response regulator transcription factor [Egibacteraceae bacterium]